MKPSEFSSVKKGPIPCKGTSGYSYALCKNLSPAAAAVTSLRGVRLS